MSWKNLKKKKGFTLIELMIVVAIIGILAAVAIPKFADLVTKSKEASVKGWIGAVRSAVSIYYSDTEGYFPGNVFSGLTTDAKYLPGIGGTQALGRVEIPKNKTGNPGHDFGLVVAAQVTQTTDATINATVDDLTALVYTTLATAEGDLAINCSHTDTKAQKWTSY